MTKKLDLKGLKINVESLKKAVSEMPTTNGPLPDLYLQVSYDRSDGKVLTNLHTNCNGETIYHSGNIVTVGYYTSHISAQKLVDAIVNTLDLCDKSQKLEDEQQRIQAHNEAIWAKENGYSYDEDDIIK